MFEKHDPSYQAGLDAQMAAWIWRASKGWPGATGEEIVVNFPRPFIAEPG